MKLRVRLFARAKDLVGQELIEVEVGEGVTVSDFRAAVRDQYPVLTSLIPHLHVAVGTDYSSESTVLDGSREVACFPPVSGG